MSFTVPPITRVGEPPGVRWFFNGQPFNTEQDAEAAKTAFEQEQRRAEDELAKQNSPGQGQGG